MSLHDRCECGTRPATYRHGYLVAPLCDRCAHLRRSRGLDGDLPDREIDRRTIEAPVEPWEYRQPTLAETERHDTPIVLGGRTHWQQSTPVHAQGARFTAAPAPTVRREIGEHEAEIALSGATTKQAAAIRARAAGIAVAQIAAEQGVSERAIQYRIKLARERAKR